MQLTFGREIRNDENDSCGIIVHSTIKNKTIKTNPDGKKNNENKSLKYPFMTFMVQKIICAQQNNSDLCLFGF